MISSMKLNSDISKVLERFVGGFPPVIDCGEGWYPLIVRLDRDISSIDPLYTIYQIKQKFGSLRFYCNPSNPYLLQEIHKIVANTERISLLTCEETGKPGELMKKDGIYKTLHSSYKDLGWIPVTNKFS